MMRGGVPVRSSSRRFAGIPFMAMASILLIESSRANAPSFGPALEKKGYDVAVRHAIEDALEQATKKLPDIVVLDAHTCMVDYLRAVATFFRAESCGKCTPCRVGTERQVQILADLAAGRGTFQHLDELVCWGELMTDSSFCGLGQTAATAVMSGLRLFGEEFAAHTRGECPAEVCRLK